jgi:hypothetical protein
MQWVIWWRAAMQTAICTMQTAICTMRVVKWAIELMEARVRAKFTAQNKEGPIPGKEGMRYADWGIVAELETKFRKDYKSMVETGKDADTITDLKRIASW